MDPVRFTDGFDRPDTIALGLDAPRLVTVAAGALLAYAVMQSPLPFPLRVGLAVLLASCTAVLGWARYAGRPVLTWAWLALRFTLSPHSGGGVATMPSQPPQRPQPPAAPSGPSPLPEEPEAPPPIPDVEPVHSDIPAWEQWLHFETDTPTVETPREAPVVVLMDADVDQEPAPLAVSLLMNADVDRDQAPPAVTLLTNADVDAEPSAAAVAPLPIARMPMARPMTPHESDCDTSPPPVFVGAPRRVTFFSLNGGSGRTTLATEVACLLAARGRHLGGDATVRPLDVALLDLDLRSATTAVRLGIPHPNLADYVSRGADPAQLDACMVRHPSGVRALLGMPKPLASALEPARVAEIVHRLERDGAQFVVIDVAADLDAVTTWVLSAVHDIFVVLTPTATGIQDAYRTTAALRRLGLGHKLRYVVNRARGGVDLGEVMGDLGGRICSVIPYDPAVEDAENHHRITALDGDGPAAAALHDLAALLYPSLSSDHRRTRISWLPWRRRAV